MTHANWSISRPSLAGHLRHILPYIVMRSHHVFTNSLSLSPSLSFAMKSSWVISCSGAFFRQYLWYRFHAHSSQIWTLLSTRYLIFESHLRNQRSSTMIHRWNTFLVVKSGNPLLRSKRICRPNTERINGGVSHFSAYCCSTSGVKNNALSDPFSMISCKRSRYWYSGWVFVVIKGKI